MNKVPVSRAGTTGEKRISTFRSFYQVIMNNKTFFVNGKIEPVSYFLGWEMHDIKRYIDKGLIWTYKTKEK